MSPALRSKRALVTGGGAAIVKRLTRDGADVALTYVSRPDHARETAAAARASGVRALAFQADRGNARAVVGAVAGPEAGLVIGASLTIDAGFTA